jgi:sulfite reductase beta subunit-like hemoprotein
MKTNGSRPLWLEKLDVDAVKRGGLDVDLERLEREGYESLTAEEFYRLKTWGVCSQRTPGLHMIRIRVPGGRISSGHLRSVADISAAHADGGAHITSRQNLELHSVPSRQVRVTLARLGQVGLITRSACGHTVRNVVGCTRAGICAAAPFDVRPTIQAVHDFFLSRAAEVNARLPRRLNIFVAGCGRCMSQAQVNDLGFVPTTEGREAGFQLWCGGSSASQPRVAVLLLGFVPLAEVLSVTEAVTDVYCEHGFRTRPAKARLKFLVEEWGEERFVTEVLGRLRVRRPDARSRREPGAVVVGGDRRSEAELQAISPQREEGYVCVEARVPLGDLSGAQLRGLADLADRCGDGQLWLSREQNAELHWVAASAASPVLARLEQLGLAGGGAGGLVDVQVCAGNEWCVWGVGDSRGLARRLDGALKRLAVVQPDARSLRVHISGCSHGCAQHCAADVGLHAVAARDGDQQVEGFETFAGGRLGNDPSLARRLGRVAGTKAEEAVVGLIRDYLEQRLPDEDMSSFAGRVLRPPPAGAGGQPTA